MKAIQADQSQVLPFPTGGMEGAVVEGVTSSVGEAKISLRLPDEVGVQARLFGPLARAGIVVDVIVQVPGADGLVHLTFTVPMSMLEPTLRLLGSRCPDLGAPGALRWEGNLCKVSLFGVGMRSHAGVALKMFELLGREGIAIHLISTSEIRISCLIDGDASNRAIRALRAGFGLTEQNTPPRPRSG
jgi:aspartate kinase